MAIYVVVIKTLMSSTISTPPQNYNMDFIYTCAHTTITVNVVNSVRGLFENIFFTLVE